MGELGPSTKRPEDPSHVPAATDRGRRRWTVAAAVFLREVHDWRWVLAAAPLLGLLSWLAPYLPSLRNQSPEEVRTASVVLCLGLFGGGFALALGSSLLVRDLAERRLGFYLARPVPEGTLWLGKLAAAVVLLAMAMAAVAVPGWLASGASMPDLPAREGDAAVASSALEHSFAFGFVSSAMPRALSPPALVALIVLLLLLAVLVVHAGATWLRARGAWLLLDAAGILGVGLFLWSLRDALLAQQAFGALVLAERFLVVAGVVVLLVAGWLQVRRGRVDMAAGRRVLSGVTWAGAALALLGLGAYATFVLSPEVDDADEIHLGRVSPDGRYLLFGGGTERRGGYAGLFLADLEASAGGARMGWHLGGWAPIRATARFSADGSVLVFPRCRRLAPTECELFALELGTGDPGDEPRPTYIPLHDFFGRLAVSPDGNRVAIGGPRTLAVYRVTDGGVETVLRTGDVIRLRFLDRSRIRFSHAHWDEAPEPEIEELDLETGERRRVGSLPAAPNPRASNWLAGGDRLVYHTVGPPRLQLRSAATGELLLDLLETLDLGPDEHFRRALFLRDGRLVLTFGRSSADRAGRSLWIVDPAAPESARRLQLDSYTHVLPRVEIAPGLLLLEARSTGGSGSTHPFAEAGGAPTAEGLGLPTLESWLTLELDVDTGEVRPWVEGIVPSPFSAGRLEPGSGPSRHFLAGGHALVRYRGEHLRPRSAEDFEILLRPFPGAEWDLPGLLD